MVLVVSALIAMSQIETTQKGTTSKHYSAFCKPKTSLCMFAKQEEFKVELHIPKPFYCRELLPAISFNFRCLLRTETRT